MSTPYYTGNSGNSTGEHLDFRVWDVEKGTWTDPRPHTHILSVNGGSLAETFDVTSPYGMRTHPIHGDDRMHHGIDFATPAGTAVTINGGTFRSTYDDSGGGRTSQYSFTGADGRQYDAILMHGSPDNAVTSDSFVTYESDAPPAPQTVGQVPSADTEPAPVLASTGESDEPAAPADAGTSGDRQTAAERVAAYKKMSKSEMNAAYDKMRNEDPVKAKTEGMAMHRAYFNK